MPSLLPETSKAEIIPIAYDAVWKHLKEGLKDSPESLSAIGLVIRTFNQVDEGGIYSIGSDYSEVPTEAGR